MNAHLLASGLVRQYLTQGADRPTAHLLATGVVIDDPANGTIFPSAGGNSADPRVQAIYWRCAVVLMASARIHGPDLRLALFSNVDPPVLDGVDLAAAFAALEVEVHCVPARSRLPAGTSSSFGNVFYFLDIFDALAAEDDDLQATLVDCDVVVNAIPEPALDRLARRDFAGYRLATLADQDINGLSLQDMAQVATALDARIATDAIPHFGGEIISCSLGAWRARRALFHALFDNARRQSGAAHVIRTEEHIYSIAFAMMPGEVAQANRVIRRIWTSPRHNDVRPEDAAVPFWHLPAEKRYGIADLYRNLARRGFDQLPEPDEFRILAARLCGIPRKPMAKIMHDRVRQVAARLGLRR